MRKQSLSIAKSVILWFMLLGGFKAAANIAEPDTTLIKANVQYVGSNQNLLEFNIDYPNAEGKKFLLEVRDDEHELLYTKGYKNKHFSKKLYVLKSEEKRTISFTIRGGKAWYNQTFEINPETKTIHNYMVTKL